jgi:hypothetical protein
MTHDVNSKDGAQSLPVSQEETEIFLPSELSEREAVLEIVGLVRELLSPAGMVNRGVDRGLVVVEKADRSDPHYRLCTAMERFDAIALRSPNVGVGEGNQGVSVSQSQPSGIGPSDPDAGLGVEPSASDFCARGDRCVCDDPSPRRCNAFKDASKLPRRS